MRKGCGAFGAGGGGWEVGVPTAMGPPQVGATPAAPGPARLAPSLPPLPPRTIRRSNPPCARTEGRDAREGRSQVRQGFGRSTGEFPRTPLPLSFKSFKGSAALVSLPNHPSPPSTPSRCSPGSNGFPLHRFLQPPTPLRSLGGPPPHPPPHPLGARPPLPRGPPAVRWTWRWRRRGRRGPWRRPSRPAPPSPSPTPPSAPPSPP